MPSIIVVGSQWGDEGKGKIVDFLSSQAQHVIRSQGGNNAGHTVLIGSSEYKLHLIPSGILHPGTQCYIGAGTVIDPEVLLEEIATLQTHGIHLTNRLWISPKAHVLFSYHRQQDALFEKRMGNDAIGTTGRGIGPCYADKANRIGIRIAEWIRPDIFRHSLKITLEIKNSEFTSLYGVPPIDFERLLSRYASLAEQISPFVGNVEEKIGIAINNQENVLLEGAQGTFLDITSGTYPFVTSSSTTAGGICAGACIGPRAISHTLGIAKAYTTRVGNGPLPTEIKDADAIIDHKKAREFGTTTGRKRRIGWFDAVLAKEAVRVNGMDSLAITKLDVLDGFDSIKICTAYQHNGRHIFSLPEVAEDLAAVTPVYEEMPGWKQETSAVQNFQDLPMAAQAYLKKIEAICGIPISLVSVGPERQQTFILKSVFAKETHPS